MSIVLLTPQEARDLIEKATSQAIAPILDRLDNLEKKLVTGKLCYSSQEAGELVGVSARTVISWIREGKTDKDGRLWFLGARELTKGRFGIELNDLHTFITHF